MLRKLRDWLAKNRQWNEEHERAWSGIVDPGPDGLSAFQRETEALVQATLSKWGMHLVDRRLIRTQGDAANHVEARIPALGVEIWIFRDQTDISSGAAQLRLEEWDAKTPEEHHDRVIAFLTKVKAEKDVQGS